MLFRSILILMLWCSVIFVKAQQENNLKGLSLQQAIQISLVNNLNLIAAQKEIDAAEGRILQAGRLQNAEFSFDINEVPASLDFGETGELDLNFSQTIEFFGKRSTRIQSAELQKKIAKLNYERIKKLITSEVKKTYSSGLLANQIVESIHSNINLLNDFLLQVTDRYQAGTSSYLDVIRAKVELSGLKNDLFDAMKNYQQVIGELKVLMGREIGTEYNLSDSLYYQFAKINKDTVIIYHSSQSNFLNISKIQIEQNKSYLLLAEKNSLPDFNFGLALQNRQYSAKNGFDQFFGFNVGVSLPMFYSSGVRGDVQEAEANLSISDIRFQYARLRVEQSIRTAFDNLSFAEEQLHLFDSTLLIDVEDELRAGISAYQNSQIDLLNLFDILRTYRSTKIEYARTVYNTIVSYTNLEIASELFENE